VVISRYLQKHNVLNKINGQVRFARKRFGRYEVVDFLVVLFGYAISGERTLEEFYERLQPFAVPFMALFERDRLPSRSALSRFLAALTEEPVETLHALFLDDLLARPLTPDKQTGGLVDRAGQTWIVFDIDGTREAARQRALPQTDELPPAFRRWDEVCAPGYRGRKRGEVVRTRTTVSQAHSYQWLGNQSQQRPESQVERSLYDCPQIPVGPEGKPCRVVVATHPAGKEKSPVGVTRAGIVYELFFTNLPQHAFTTCDVVELYLHRGAFEPALSDEDREQDPDRWCSHSAWGQECWQTVSQWVWNLRLELGHQLEPTPMRITEFAPAISAQNAQAATRPTATASASGYGPPTTATSWKTGRFTGQDFPLQPDGTLRCPAGRTLTLQERRQEAEGSLRLVYAASIRSCRPCELREQCQWNGSATKKPRQVSVLLHPLSVGSEPLLWQDWSRRVHRRACIHLLRSQRIEVQGHPPGSDVATSPVTPALLTRAERAHTRLAWESRLARNARPEPAGRVTIKLFGIPEGFAILLGRSPA
jgi:hypothetical protein